MALTLGENLRQAREARGLTISDVAEGTRISSLYLECIENNDYRPLPGGIFNKGFVKSYAKFVGLDDQEALQEYAKIHSEQTGGEDDSPKTYRPEVLTDDYTRRSLFPTILFSVIILGLLVWGVFAFLRYYDKNKPETAADTNANAAVNSNSNSSGVAATPSVEPLGPLKFELSTSNAGVSFQIATDSDKKAPFVPPDKPLVLEPKESLTLRYAREQTPNIGLKLNGKKIALPPLNSVPKGNIEITINKTNALEVFQKGEVAASNAAGSAPTKSVPR
jgi:cytoskeleton protein RodZ